MLHVSLTAVIFCKMTDMDFCPTAQTKPLARTVQSETSVQRTCLFQRTAGPSLYTQMLHMLIIFQRVLPWESRSRRWLGHCPPDSSWVGEQICILRHCESTCPSGTDDTPPESATWCHAQLAMPQTFCWQPQWSSLNEIYGALIHYVQDVWVWRSYLLLKRTLQQVGGLWITRLFLFKKCNIPA